MSAKLFVFFFTVFLYGCTYHNNSRSGKKTKVSHKYIKFVFPLSGKRSDSEVDIILYLEAGYLIISCIGYYTATFFDLISYEIATMIWMCMFIGTTLVAAGGEIIRDAREGSTIIITILEFLFGIILVLIGSLISILTVIRRYDILLNYFV
ncbi:hypothetical protein RZO55_21370 [Clostridium boliviensis]|uniref:Uncharacterized protein n=1 Tax=Clostridium boliviensis TaxID=318465 RepID=A0ABU4GV72_9CLOT|nr:hypothetical protein [Clostridium boliviensis]MDW2800127.1 hypothetical protein [Clostridium boliviensis]